MNKHRLGRLLALVGALLLAVGTVNATDEQRTVIAVGNVSEIAVIRETTFDGVNLRDLVVHPDSKRLAVILRQREAVSSLDGDVIFLEVESLEMISPGPIALFANTMTFSPDGTLFAVGTASGVIHVFDAETLDPYSTIQAGTDIINDIAIDLSNTLVGVTAGIPTIEFYGSPLYGLYSLPDGEELVSFSGEDDLFGGGVTFDSRGEFVFFSLLDYSGENSLLHYWRVPNSPRMTRSIGFSRSRFLAYDQVRNALMIANDNSVNAFTPAYNDGTNIPVFDSIDDTEQLLDLTTHPTEPILAVSLYRQFASDSPAGYTEGSTIQLVHTDTGEILTQLNIPNDVIIRVDFSNDGTWLAAGGLTGMIQMWGIPND